MRKQGTVARFDTDRGFGFIRSPQTSADIFFHIKNYRSPDIPIPRLGMPVSFEEIHVGGKGPRAMAVRPAGEESERTRTAAPSSSRRPPSRQRAEPAPSSGAWFILPLMFAYAAAVGWGVSMQKLPWWLLLALPALNLLAFMAYWHDKYAAQQRQWRIKEDTLHFWSLAGGWPGAWFAQQLLQHKTRKASFQDLYRFTIVAHCAALGGWLWWTRDRLPGQFFDF